MMRLAGLNITDDCALELVRRLRCADFAHQADTIEGALVLGQAEDELAHGREGMSQPFHCLTPEEAALTHRLFTAALTSQRERSVVAV